tara:strand:+ start:74 stop:595 length:522 start_codon:yes stop_codon:yes gene_type:complete
MFIRNFNPLLFVSQTYIASHGATDFLIAKESMNSSSVVVNSPATKLALVYPSILISFHQIGLPAALPIFIFLSSIHFADDFYLENFEGGKNPSFIYFCRSLIFVTACSYFNMPNLMQAFLVYHSTKHYKKHLSLISRNKTLFLITSLLAIGLAKQMSFLMLIAFASAHIIFTL